MLSTEVRASSRSGGFLLSHFRQAPPFNTMVIEADPTPFWLAVPGLLALSLIFLVYSGLSARQTEINYGE